MDSDSSVSSDKLCRKLSTDAGVYNSSQDPRLCRDASLTVEHMVAGCTLHAGIAYTEKHNHVAGEQEHLCPAWIRSTRVTLGQSQMFVILVDPTL